jgi:hypothetical protein
MTEEGTQLAAGKGRKDGSNASEQDKRKERNDK